MLSAGCAAPPRIAPRELPTLVALDEGGDGGVDRLAEELARDLARASSGAGAPDWESGVVRDASLERPVFSEFSEAWVAKAKDPADDASFRVGVEYELWELNKVKLDFDTGPTVTLDELARRRYIGRARYGSGRFGVFAEGGVETWHDAGINGVGVDPDGSGWFAGGGVDGYVPLSRAADPKKVRPVLEYLGALTYHHVEFDDVTFFLGDARVKYLELQARLGLGIDFAGLRVAAGGITSLIRGDFDGALGSADVEAENFGGYAAVAYEGVDVPIAVRLQGVLGDIFGISAAVELRF
ncbi:MAG TPA: hypothetical protein VKE69_03640 [Planctomycetota bacterium]|nr:hypothetical protein [Planctomycetota bacterium]